METIRIWIYLARRDKSAVELLTSVLGEKQTPNRLTDLAPLLLPQSVRNQIEKKVTENKLLWELWIESADNFDDLRTALRNRGYKQIPTSGTPIFNSYQIVINNKFLPQTKSMLRSN